MQPLKTQSFSYSATAAATLCTIAKFPPQKYKHQTSIATLTAAPTLCSDSKSDSHATGRQAALAIFHFALRGIFLLSTLC